MATLGAQPGGRQPAAARDWQRTAILVAVIPFFAQSFHYMKDLLPLWAISKAFPLLSLPLAFGLTLRRQEVDPGLWLGVIAWLVVVSSLAGVFTFEQSFFLGLTAQVKLLGMLHVLSLLGLLIWLRPTLRELGFAILLWGALTAVVVALLGALAPQEWYQTDYEFGDAPLLSADDRGNRIRMPMFFALVSLFVLYRHFLVSRDWRALLLAVAVFALLVLLVKTRAVMLATAGTLVIVSLFAASPAMRIVAVCLSAIGALVLLQLPFIASMFESGTGTGLGVRMVTIQKATAFLGDNPLLWLFGAGTITPLDADGMARYFNHFFFLADIAWTGIVFEFGLLGAAMIAGLLARTWWLGRGLQRGKGNALLGGLQDYVLMVILMSPLYSTMTLQPGEVATVAAILLYARMIARQNPPVEHAAA